MAIASDLVRTKVDNEGLRDENEGLKGQVEELKKVVETQTQEVEAKMKDEMEAVMERNVEIFGENRRLEEELGEMEKVLVGVKMEFAEVSLTRVLAWKFCTNVDAAAEFESRGPEAEVEQHCRHDAAASMMST